MQVFVLNCAIILALSVLAVVAMLWFRRRVGTDALRRNHEVAGFVYSVVGAIFAVTVALGADTAHDEYIQAERVAAAEAIRQISDAGSAMPICSVTDDEVEP